MPAGDIVVTERSPTHQVQIFNQYGQFVRKFGANVLQHPRGVTVDNRGRIVIVECKVRRIVCIVCRLSLRARLAFLLHCISHVLLRVSGLYPCR